MLLFYWLFYCLGRRVLFIYWCADVVKSRNRNIIIAFMVFILTKYIAILVFHIQQVLINWNFSELETKVQIVQ